jgi:hypothetical protein
MFVCMYIYEYIYEYIYMKVYTSIYICIYAYHDHFRLYTKDMPESIRKLVDKETLVHVLIIDYYEFIYLHKM